MHRILETCLPTLLASTVIVAEDHPMFRAALVLTLRRLMPSADFVEVASQTELMKALALHPQAAMLLLDLKIPGARGLSSLILVRGEYPDVPVAIVSGVSFADTIQSARALGASAFIPKSATPQVISAALESVLGGRAWFAEPSDPSQPATAKDSLDKLSPQQFRVLNHLVEGLLNKQIAEKLSISEGTVRAHVSGIFKKLNVNTRTQAVLLVTEMYRGPQAEMDEGN